MHAGERLDQAMRELRILHSVFLVTVILLVTAGEILPFESQNELPSAVAMVMAMACAGQVSLGWKLRKKHLDEAREKLQRQPDDPEGVAAWRVGHILGFAFAEAAAILGLLFRLLSGSLVYATPFYVIGTALLLAWTPRRPD
jgi:hypothetical protein